jgi:transcription elongation GreA/GreB family factor
LLNSKESLRAVAAGDREGVGRASRELRYWTARRATAEVGAPSPEGERVVFGVAVTVRRDDGTRATFRIVGEDEADPAVGRIAWTAPVARALLGGSVGDLRELPTGEVEIVSIDPIPEAETPAGSTLMSGRCLPGLVSAASIG